MIRRLLIRHFSRFALRSPSRLPGVLQRFAEIEADSAWQMIQVMNSGCDARLKAKLFENTLEELDHAAAFRGLAAELSAQPLPTLSPARARMFLGPDSLAAFEADHFVGEQEIFGEFSAYAEVAGPGRVRETFLAIQADESGHQELARAELERIAGSRNAAAALIRRARLKRLIASLGQAFRAGGDVTTGLILVCIFAVAAPLFGRSCRARL